MNQLSPKAAASRPALILAFLVLYCSWGTTYLAIRIGVADLPPCLFGGTRLALAGLILLAVLSAWGQTLRLSRKELAIVALAGMLFFMGGNGLLTYAQTKISSGMAALLVAQTPLWFALMESFVPGGERLTFRGWLGLIFGLLGVVLLKFDWKAGFAVDLGFSLATASSISWSLGSLLVRHQTTRLSPFVAAGYQMILGGGALALVGLALGEADRVSADTLTRSAVLAFFYLLVVGSLGGFVAYNFLLAHVSPALASTYAYVNPCVALWVGWLILDERVHPYMIGCMVVILGGVGLIRLGGIRHSARSQEDEPAPLPKLPDGLPDDSVV